MRTRSILGLLLIPIASLIACSTFESSPRKASEDPSFYLPCKDVDVTHDGVVGMPDYLQMAKKGASYRQMASLEHWFGQKCE